jgi:hypothetical protein
MTRSDPDDPGAPESTRDAGSVVILVCGEAIDMLLVQAGDLLSADLVFGPSTDVRPPRSAE